MGDVVKAVGEDEEDESGEEARPLITRRDPGCPTAAEREAHEHNHLPFRSWCDECVKGRLDNPPHRRQEAEERGIPEVMMDYGFVSRTGDKKSVVILVTKDRDSRVIISNMVMHKGHGDEEAIEQGQKNIKRLGSWKRCILKTDNEPALISLRDGIANKLQGGNSD